MACDTVSVLGVSVLPQSREDLLCSIRDGVASGKQVVIPHHNLHSAALFKSDPGFREFFLRYPGAHIDGMGLVLWARLIGLPLRPEHRVTYLDLIGPLMELAAGHDWQVFHLGGKPAVGERVAEDLRRTYGVRIAVHHGYFDSDVNREIVDLISRSEPQLVLVGMGMPLQERWLLNNLPTLPSAVYLCSGGCFDYLAGEQKAPPRWSGKLGIEWLFRLAHQPRRLGARYLVEPLRLLPEAREDIVAAWRRRKYGRS